MYKYWKGAESHGCFLKPTKLFFESTQKRTTQLKNFERVLPVRPPPHCNPEEQWQESHSPPKYELPHEPEMTKR